MGIVTCELQNLSAERIAKVNVDQDSCRCRGVGLCGLDTSFGDEYSTSMPFLVR